MAKKKSEGGSDGEIDNNENAEGSDQQDEEIKKRRNLLTKVGGSLRHLVKGKKKGRRTTRSSSPSRRNRRHHKVIRENREYNDNDDSDSDSSSSEDSFTYQDFRRSVESANGYGREEMGEIDYNDSFFANDMEGALEKAFQRAKKDKKHKHRISQELNLDCYFDDYDD